MEHITMYVITKENCFDPNQGAFYTVLGMGQWLPNHGKHGMTRYAMDVKTANDLAEIYSSKGIECYVTDLNLIK